MPVPKTLSAFRSYSIRLKLSAGPKERVADEQRDPEPALIVASEPERKLRSHASRGLRKKVSTRFKSSIMVDNQPDGNAHTNGTAHVHSTPAPDGTPHANGAASTPEQSPSRPPTSRATSTKIAGLLAAFEKDSPDRATSPSQRRPSSRHSSFQRNADQDVELSKLRTQLLAETELRVAYESKVSSLEDEVEKMNLQLRERDEVWEREFERKNEAVVAEKVRAVDEMKAERRRRMQLLQEKGDLEEDLERAEGQREDFKQQLNELRKTDRGNESRSPECDVAPRPVNGEVDKKLLHAEGETRTLKSQVAELKRTISVSTRVESEVLDSTFVQEMGRLQHEVQNWVVNQFRKAKVQQSKEEVVKSVQQVTGVDEQAMRSLESMYENIEPSSKLAIFQSTVVVVLQEVFSEPYLYGLREGDPWADSVRTTADTLASVLIPVTYNKWRSTTFDALRHTPAIEGQVDIRAVQLAKTICILLEKVTLTESNENRATNLKQIVKRAISLAHLFRVQRARYEISLPGPGKAFEASTMEDVAFDAEEGVQRTIVCSTFPGVLKIGNGQDNSSPVRSVVVRSKVFCGSDG